MKYTWSSETLQSQALNGRRVYRIALPEGYEGKKRLPLLLLLHGVDGAETNWIDKGGLIESLEQLTEAGRIGPMAVVTPSDGLAGRGSGYLNWTAGTDNNYEDYIIQDLLQDIEQKWNVGGSRELRGIGGLSMGGFGAIRLSLANTHLFASGSSLSGFFDVALLEKYIGSPQFQLMFEGGARRMQEHSPIFMKLQGVPVPNLLFDCGIEDPFIEQNRAFHQRLQEQGAAHEYAEYEGGHSWDYWKAQIGGHLQFHYKAMNVHEVSALHNRQ